MKLAFTPIESAQFFHIWLLFYTDISAKSLTFCISGRSNKIDPGPASFNLRNSTHPNLRNPTYPTHNLTPMALIENNMVNPSASFNLGNPTHVTQRNPTHSNLRNPNLPNQRNPTHHPTHNLTPMAWTLETSM